MSGLRITHDSNERQDYRHKQKIPAVKNVTKSVTAVQKLLVLLS